VETEKSLWAVVNDADRQALFEDAEDLAAFEETANEPNLSFEEALKQIAPIEKGLRQAKAGQFASRLELARVSGRRRRKGSQ